MNNCGKKGHLYAKCWQQEAKKGLRPDGYTVPNETGNARLDGGSGSNVEFYCGE